MRSDFRIRVRPHWVFGLLFAFALIAPSAQVMTTRSEPLTPAPVRTETALGAGAVDQVLGELLLPTLKTKSLAVIDVWSASPARSIMMPLIPLS